MRIRNLLQLMNRCPCSQNKIKAKYPLSHPNPAAGATVVIKNCNHAYVTLQDMQC